MIAGTFVLEDQSIQFHLMRSGLIEYTVHDAISGIAAAKAVGPAEFSEAMHFALLGEDASKCLYEWAVIAMPSVKDIHDLSEMAPAEAEAAVRNLRWIPQPSSCHRSQTRCGGFRDLRHSRGRLVAVARTAPVGRGGGVVKA